MKYLFRFSIFLESFFFLAYFSFYTLYNSFLFLTRVSSIPELIQAIFERNAGIILLLQLSEIIILIFSVAFNGLLVVSLLIRKNLRQPPDRLIEIVMPLLGTLGVGLYNLTPNLPESWTANFAPEPLYPYCLLAGSLVAIVGLIIAIRSIYDLRESFGILVQVRDVVRRGIYQWVRHPMYLGHMTIGLGFLLIQPNLANLLITALVILANIERALLEERKIAATSPEYREFQKQVPFMIPIKRRTL